MKTISYVRVSTAGQVTDGDGLGVQREKIHAWVSIHAVGAVEEHEDAGISGSRTENRPGLRAALQSALRAGRGSTLVVTKLDRLGRNALDVQETLALLLDAGVRVVSVLDGLDSASGLGSALLRGLVGLLGAFAEIERDAIRTRCILGRQKADREDRRYASEPRYGRLPIEPGGKELVLSEAEEKVIARSKELRSAGASFQEICDHLMAEGYRPRRAAAWSPTVVRRLVVGQRTKPKTAMSKRLSRARADLLGEA